MYHTHIVFRFFIRSLTLTGHYLVRHPPIIQQENWRKNKRGLSGPGPLVIGRFRYLVCRTGVTQGLTTERREARQGKRGCESIRLKRCTRPSTVPLSTKDHFQWSGPDVNSRRQKTVSTDLMRIRASSFCRRSYLVPLKPTHKYFDTRTHRCTFIPVFPPYGKSG